MTDRLAILAAALIAIAGIGIATAINALAEYEAMGPQVDATIQRAKSELFTHQACADCPVMRVNYYVPPKP